jgi:hypothetical protein
MTPRQAAQALRDRMAEQVERMVSASILKKMRQEWETVALAVAVVPVITEVGVQEDIDRMGMGMQAILQAVKRTPIRRCSNRRGLVTS